MLTSLSDFKKKFLNFLYNVYSVPVNKYAKEFITFAHFRKSYTEKKKFSSSFKLGEDLIKVAVKEADRQASQSLKMRPSKTKKWDTHTLGYHLTLRARRGFTAITGPRFSVYIRKRMMGMAMDSGSLRPVPTRCPKIDVFSFLLCIRIHYAH